MASGIGLGGFAQGLSDGMQKGLRFVTDAEKARREEEKYQLEKPQLELQADQAKRKNAAAQQAQAEYNAWLKQSTMDPDGNPLAPEQMPDDFTKRAAFFNLTQKALMDQQAMDPDQFMKMAAYGRELKKEGMADAMQTFMRTGDQTKALNVWNQQGAKAPEGTQLRMTKDETGMPDVEIVSPDGKVIGTFNQAMFFMSADNVAKQFGEMQKVKFQEGQATKRTGISAGATIEAARMNNAGAMDRQILENQNRITVAGMNAEYKAALAKDPVFEQIKGTLIETTSKALGNNLNSMNYQKIEADAFNTAAVATDLIRRGQAPNIFAAIALAKKQLGLDGSAVPTAPKK